MAIAKRVQPHPDHPTSTMQRVAKRLTPGAAQALESRSGAEEQGRLPTAVHAAFQVRLPR
jgi:hypothetical protein